VAGTPATGQNYIYAVPYAGGIATFRYLADKPVWDAAQNGWYYSGADETLAGARAVAKVHCVSSQYNNKVLLDSYRAINEINKSQPLPKSGGTQIVTGTVNQVNTATLEPGYYRYEMKAGSGGNGGNSGTNTGGSGANGEEKSSSFLMENIGTAMYVLGADGADGNNSSTDKAGAGGGASGGGAFIDVQNNFKMSCRGGSGGAGAGNYYAGALANYYGGSGAGGFGLGSKGSDSNSGLGGNNGVGGNGVGTGGAGGGEIPGTGTNPGTIFGGGNSASSGGNNIFAPYYSSFKDISFGGGGASNSGAGRGGSGLKSSSSGYLRIYKVG
jgi:hypothetical protein